ncbi:hypothetical protein [Streptomyces enissocaesilis]
MTESAPPAPGPVGHIAVAGPTTTIGQDGAWGEGGRHGPARPG